MESRTSSKSFWALVSAALALSGCAKCDRPMRCGDAINSPCYSTNNSKEYLQCTYGGLL